MSDSTFNGDEISIPLLGALASRCFPLLCFRMCLNAVQRTMVSRRSAQGDYPGLICPTLDRVGETPHGDSAPNEMVTRSNAHSNFAALLCNSTTVSLSSAQGDYPGLICTTLDRVGETPPGDSASNELVTRSNAHSNSLRCFAIARRFHAAPPRVITLGSSVQPLTGLAKRRMPMRRLTERSGGKRNGQLECGLESVSLLYIRSHAKNTRWKIASHTLLSRSRPSGSSNMAASAP